MKKYTLVLALLITGLFVAAQNAPEKATRPLKQKIFGNIYAGYYLGLNDNSVPKSGFEMPTALFGIFKELSENVKATLVYDVTRTTNFTFTDSSGVSGYFEGSKYTAFLKMAQIDWRIQPSVELSVGQLLNEQYLTIQDKWWNHRYIDVTFQEKNRFGMPADFGARLKYYYKEKLAFSLTAFNGDGPFRHQDDNAKFLFSGNLEFTPTKRWMFKVYSDVQQAQVDTLENKMALSFFSGYRNEKVMAGLEFNMLNNANYSDDDSYDYSGISVYGSYKLNKKWEALTRFDYMLKHISLEENLYVLGGLQYSPAPTYHISCNYRYHSLAEQPVLYVNFGAKF